MYIEGEHKMNGNSDYYIVEGRVLPEVFLKVVEAKKLIDRGEVSSVQDAVEKAGVSRSAYYKYKDCVSPLNGNTRGKIAVLAFDLEDKAGLLSLVLNIMAEHGANVLTINQTIPVGGVASVTITADTENMTAGVREMLDGISKIKGVLRLKIIARE